MRSSSRFYSGPVKITTVNSCCRRCWAKGGKQSYAPSSDFRGFVLGQLAWWYWWSWLSTTGPLCSPRAFLPAWVLGASAVSVLPCTGGRTAECVLGLFSYQCCVRAALYKGQECRMCSQVCGPVSHRSVWLTKAIHAGMQNGGRLVVLQVLQISH